MSQARGPNEGMPRAPFFAGRPTRKRRADVLPQGCCAMKSFPSDSNERSRQVRRLAGSCTSTSALRRRSATVAKRTLSPHAARTRERQGQRASASRGFGPQACARVQLAQVGAARGVEAEAAGLGVAVALRKPLKRGVRARVERVHLRAAGQVWGGAWGRVGLCGAGSGWRRGPGWY